jgi:hypothetical protein
MLISELLQYLESFWRRHKRPPSPPRNVHLFVQHARKGKKMATVTLQWGASATGAPTTYSAVWTQNGTALPAVSVPVVSGQATYSLDFAASTGKTINPGDVIGATVQALDSVNNLQSAIVPSVPATVTIPTGPVPPGPPLNVTLAAS